MWTLDVFVPLRYFVEIRRNSAKESTIKIGFQIESWFGTLIAPAKNFDLKAWHKISRPENSKSGRVLRVDRQPLGYHIFAARVSVSRCPNLRVRISGSDSAK